MGKISLYDRAVVDYKQGIRALADAHIDDAMCDMAGYHLQESVEKLLKYQIEQKGEIFPFSHDISLLIDMVDDVPSWIIDNSQTLTKYEALTRYSSVKVASRTHLNNWYKLLSDYIDNLRPKEEIREEFSPSHIFAKENKNV